MKDPNDPKAPKKPTTRRPRSTADAKAPKGKPEAPSEKKVAARKPPPPKAEEQRPAPAPPEAKPSARAKPPQPAHPSRPAYERFSLLTDQDIYLFNEGTHVRLYERLGAHRATVDGREGTFFAVWAPNAKEVSVVGSFNGWDRDTHPLHTHGSSGIWEGFLPGIGKGDLYKFFIKSRHNNYTVEKADPFGVHHETPPKTASIVWDLDYEWNDGEWMRTRGGRNSLHAPMSTYEVHLGSWRRVPEDGNRWLSYREIAEPLAEHVRAAGFTHVELLPITEHPFYGSWGYQTTGYFAPTSRYGTPQDLMYLVDYLHQQGIGVILDWVPSHFPGDQHGLSYFDGTYLFEHSDPRQGFHPDWNSYIFNYGRNEVRAFLLSSAIYWLERYHIDGIRVDAVASMLYLDYSRNEGEWIPNQYGGRENLEAIDFLRRFNTDVFGSHPDTQTIAEESTAWPMVSRPTYVGGLGFGLKWDMGWMHDTLQYFSRDAIHRKFHHGELTFRMIYAFNENFVLPLSHDEVVHGKGSLLGKMPNDEWQKFANLRLLYSYMWSQPGKKLLFMGCEMAPWTEWNHDESLPWHLTGYEAHAGIQRTVSNLNRIYRDYPAMHQLDLEPAGFEWIDGGDAEQSVLSYLRRGREGNRPVAVVLNLTPTVRDNYRIGVPSGGRWNEIFNSDAAEFGGSGHGNFGGVDAAPVGTHGRPHSLTITVPPLGAVFFTPEGA
ncbi:MAG TPA: 1,4-alpha-glucan branching protein GlgB [Thermoanaerobaculia bacterium]|nr:1,4-alpha-glucan branching protein GlgB [Thermoanaerobaculia bacterium]